MKLNTAEWKMLVYYDLTPFASEIKSLSTGLQSLQQMCPVIQQHEMCDMFVSNFKHIKMNYYRKWSYLPTDGLKDLHSI